MQATQLIDRLKRGDPEALQYVYNHSKAYCIGRLGRTIGCQPSDAEDIFMDAVLVFRENVMHEKLTEVVHLRAYLFKVCRNLYHEQQHREEQARAAEHAVRSRLYEDAITLPDDFPRQKALVMQAFRYLGGNCRRMLQYYYFEHRSLEEIAQKMNLANTNVVKATKSRCYKKWVEAVNALKQQSDA